MSTKTYELECSDGKCCTVNKDDIMHCILLQEIIESCADETVIKVPQVTYDVVVCIISLLRDSSGLKALSHAELARVLQGADYLNAQTLLSAIFDEYASRLSGRTTEEMRQIVSYV
jgi:hypothetical protein